MEIREFNESYEQNILRWDDRRKEAIIRGSNRDQVMKIIKFPDHDYISICDDQMCIKIPSHLIESVIDLLNKFSS